MQISLTNRNLTEFDASAFSTKEEREMLYKISKLDVSHNRLTLVKGMQCLSNLTTLDVSCNSIRSLACLPLKIRRLNVSENDLKSLEGLAALTQLEFLDVSKNDLGSLIGLPATQSLRHLEAANNKMVSVKGIELTPALHYFNVSSNLIRRVEDLHSLKQLRALKTLVIGTNPITATNRNTAAIRMSVPKITVIEGLMLASQTADVYDEINEDVSHRMQHNLKETSHIRSASAGGRGRSPAQNNSVGRRRSSSADQSMLNGTGGRPISPIGRRVSTDATPNTSAVSYAAPGLSAPRTHQQGGNSSSAAPQQPALSVGGPTQKGNQTTYERLLRDLELSKIKAQRGIPSSQVFGQQKSASVRGTSPSGLNSTHITGSSPATQQGMDKYARSRSADTLRKNTLAKAGHLDSQATSMRTGVIPHTCPETVVERDARINASIANSYNGRGPTLASGGSRSSSAGGTFGRDGTYERDLLNASQPSIELHRVLEQRVAQLEKELAFALRRLDDKSAECDTAHLQVKQLKETIDRQAKVNALLADNNRSLTQQHNGNSSAHSSHNTSASALHAERPRSGQSSPKKLDENGRRPQRNDQQLNMPIHKNKTSTTRASGSQSPRNDTFDFSSSPNRTRSGPTTTKSASAIGVGSPQTGQVNGNGGGALSGPSAAASGTQATRRSLEQQQVNVVAGPHRASQKEPKRPSAANSSLQPSNYHQSMAPVMTNNSVVLRNSYTDPSVNMSGVKGGAAYVHNQYRESPQRNSGQNSRNVSFGGSLFYSPPQHYNHI